MKPCHAASSWDVFQPFHLGHAGLVQAAVEHAAGDEVVVAIGSAQAGWEANNPWTADERQSMIEAWAGEEGVQLSIVQIEDINDPNWVEHATKTHGMGTLHLGRAHDGTVPSGGLGRSRNRLE